MPPATGEHGAASPTTRDAEQSRAGAPDPLFVWDEEVADGLREAQKDAELTVSVDSVRAYLNQIGKVRLLTAEAEVSSPSGSRPGSTRRRTTVGRR